MKTAQPKPLLETILFALLLLAPVFLATKVVANEAGKCDYLVIRITEVQMQYDKLHEEYNPIWNYFILNIDTPLDIRRQEISNARDTLQYTHSALRSLRHDFQHGDELIQNNLQQIDEITTQLPQEKAKLDPLKRKYKSISKWRWIKRLKAKKVYKTQIEKVHNLENTVAALQNDIKRLENIQNNFYELESQAENDIRTAENRLHRIENKRPSLQELIEEENRLSDKKEELEREMAEKERDLEVLRRSLQDCRS